MYQVLLAYFVSTIFMEATEILLCGVRESGSLIGSDSESKSGNSFDSKSLDAQGKDQKHRDHSQKNGNLIFFKSFNFHLMFIYVNINFPNN